MKTFEKNILLFGSARWKIFDQNEIGLYNHGLDSNRYMAYKPL